MNLQLIFRDKKFSPFFWTQFWGAFNDNFFKNALVVLIAFKGIHLMGLNEASLVALAGGLFILPFFIFSPLAGQLADKYEKSHIIRLTKLLEILVMLLAAIAFFFHSYLILMGLLFLMGLQSALFGPVKYSLIPELVRSERLIEGNALVEMGTFLAILLGTIGGGVFASFASAELWIGSVLFLVSVIGYGMSRKVPPAPLGDPYLKLQWNPVREYLSLWNLLRSTRILFFSVLAISWFWFFGAGVLSVLPIYVNEYLKANESVLTVFLAMFTLGIGIGSMICEWVFSKKVGFRIVPLSSLAMTLFLLDLSYIGNPWPGVPQVTLNYFFSTLLGWRLLFDFLMMSVFGGLFIVPLYTQLQQKSEKDSRSRVIAANNIFNAVFMVVTSLLIMLCYKFYFNARDILVLLAVMNGVVAICIYYFVSYKDKSLS